MSVRPARPNRALAAIPATVADLIERCLLGCMADLSLGTCATEAHRLLRCGRTQRSRRSARVRLIYIKLLRGESRNLASGA
ncbi:hypothetical protein BSZ21_23990 [Bradyrhizobium canariense]|nr:hypothetical protein BSZ21_23990 [Bradyrhizobium canariense]